MDKISSIENKDSDTSKTQGKPKTNFINISYTLIKLTPALEATTEFSHRKLAESSKYSSGVSKSKSKATEIDINNLLCASHSKEYRFQNVEISRNCSTRAKSIHKVI